MAALCVIEIMGLDTKDKLNAYLQREQITSVLNDTKWKRLFDSLSAIDHYYLDFRRKDLDREETEIWKSDLYECFGLWHKIEWVEIRTEQDHIQELTNAIKNSGVPFSVSNGVFKIWGYLRKGKSPEWA
jgi:hypothetical protein